MLAFLFGACLVDAASAAAQETGRITGVAVDARTGTPLPQVQVYLAGTQMGTVTTDDGRFVILNVPAGTHQVQAARLGYRALAMEVVVRQGEAVTLDLRLEQEVLGLDEIVVTGTAGAARRREVGNTIAQIDLERVDEPVSGVDQLLQSRVPGLVINESAGMTGAGSQIRLRGSISVSQSNQPLIYIDGIRVKSDAYQKNVPPTDFTGRSGNVTASPLSDIHPEDIDRIEVIKGAAATTLYGTEAAAGVIQIFTKRGTTGAPRWTIQIDQGFNRLRPFSPEGTVDFGMLDDGTPDIYRATPLLNMEEYVRNGWRQSYSIGVAGGGENLQYYVSANFDDVEGVLPLDTERKTGVRGNFTFTPLPDLQVTWNTAYTRNEITNTPAGNNAHGLTLNAFRQERNYFGTGHPDTIRQVLDYELDTWIDRFITGATLAYSPTANLTHRLTVGYDIASQENRNLRPYGFRAAPNGIISDQRFTSTTLTLDYVGSYRMQLTGDLASTLSFGGQSISNREINTVAKGDDLPGPGVPTVSSAAIRAGFEERLRVVNAGFFGQALFDVKNRYFLTVGVRVDGNSAFGEELGLQAYPKVSASYVISEEAFWPEVLGSVKLRAAYGQSGRAPGAFDAVKTWNPAGYGTSPAFLPENLGNPDLGPERTSEIEVGFDGAFFDNRLSAEFTYYHRKTTDALFPVRQPPSDGFSLDQLENVGSLRNSGIELALLGTIVDREAWGWDVGASVYTNESEILDLGGAAEFAAGGGWNKVGSPVMAARGHMIVNKDEKAEPIVVYDTIYGPQQPTFVLGLNTALRLPFGLDLSARGEYQTGGWIEDGASSNALQRAVRWPTCMNAYRHLNAGQRDELTAWERKMCIQENYENNLLWYPKTFFKLRDVTLSIPVDFAVPRAASARLTLSARNWYTWKHKDFLIFDPEMVGNDGFDEQNTTITEHIPPTASLVASLRVTF